MSIDDDEVRATAALARLALTDEEVERFRGDLDALLAHMSDLDALDLEGVAPTLAALPGAGGLRPDDPLPGLSPADALAAAPARDGDRFSMPAALPSAARKGRGGTEGT